MSVNGLEGEMAERADLVKRAIYAAIGCRGNWRCLLRRVRSWVLQGLEPEPTLYAFEDAHAWRRLL